MNYKIEKTSHQYQGKEMVDLLLTFENGKKWLLVPLTKNGSKASMSYFYALLGDYAK